MFSVVQSEMESYVCSEPALGPSRQDTSAHLHKIIGFRSRQRPQRCALTSHKGYLWHSFVGEQYTSQTIQNTNRDP